jgi:hypothetical protein
MPLILGLLAPSSMGICPLSDICNELEGLEFLKVVDNGINVLDDGVNVLDDRVNVLDNGVNMLDDGVDVLEVGLEMEILM